MKSDKKLMRDVVVYTRKLLIALKIFNPYHNWMLLQPNSEENGLI